MVLWPKVEIGDVTNGNRTSIISSESVEDPLYSAYIEVHDFKFYSAEISLAFAQTSVFMIHLITYVYVPPNDKLAGSWRHLSCSLVKKCRLRLEWHV